MAPRYPDPRLAGYWRLPAAERTRIAAAASPSVQRMLVEEAQAWYLNESPGHMAQMLMPRFEKQAPHLRLIDRTFQRIAAGEVDRVIIEMPPRHGKTRRASRWGVLWYLRRFPDRRIILASHAADYAATHGRWVRDHILANSEIGLAVDPNSSAANRWDLLFSEGGMLTVGAGGSPIGRGAHLMVIDDPIKTAQAAYSAAERENIWQWWTATLRTRLEPGAAVVIILHRWHEDDLAGRLLLQQLEGDKEGWPADEYDRWEVLRVPAVAEADDSLGREVGEPLWAERYDRKALLRLERGMTYADWLALYQQRPAPPEGGLFKREGLRRFYVEGDNFVLVENDADPKANRAATELRVPQASCMKFATADLAISTSESADWTVFAFWAYTGPGKLAHHGKLILMDLYRARIEGPDQLPMLEKLMKVHGCAFAGVEKAQHGTNLVQTARRAGLNVKALIPDRDKYVRAQSAAVKWQNGDMYVPRNASWVPEWLEEHVAFNHGTHDDQVDTTAYAAMEAQGLRRHTAMPL